ncbi:hypothetical protein GCM10009760_58650 [Kitasatospora kazusensis]|uniref:FAD-binding domain-containing protein n=1 Tax=Kitasatospora kazusensis TaxID=407974 RepID=A0ABP5M4T3_9ACTN
MTTIPSSTDVLIVGGGPAGTLLAVLLARRGIDVLVVEKQSTLERDVRSETIAAASVALLRDLGFAPALRRHGFLETTGISVRMEGRRVFHVDYGRFAVGVLPIDIPQPALTGILHEEAGQLPGYHRALSTTLTGLVEQGGVIRGGILRREDGERVEVRARLVVGADGRFSKVRQEAGLATDVHPVERDLLSFELPRPAGWGSDAQLVLNRGRHVFVLPAFPDLLRVGHTVPRHALGAVRGAGPEAFRAGVAAVDPRLAPLLGTHPRTWDDTAVLEVFTADAREWSRDGLILIGDASHTSTPVLGQGVNLAIQDTVLLAPVIARGLAAGGGPLPERLFRDFVFSRRLHKQAVARYQQLQEEALAQYGPGRVRLRRARLRVLNALPLKYRLLDRVVNFRHPVDPADLRADRPCAAVAAVPECEAPLGRLPVRSRR